MLKHLAVAKSNFRELGNFKCYGIQTKNVNVYGFISFMFSSYFKGILIVNDIKT